MARVPELLSDSDYTSSSASESEESDCDSEADEADWPADLRRLLAKKPRKRDYDKDWRFRPSSDYYSAMSDEERDVLGVVLTDLVNGGDKENVTHLLNKQEKNVAPKVTRTPDLTATGGTNKPSTQHKPSTAGKTTTADPTGGPPKPSPASTMSTSPDKDSSLEKINMQIVDKLSKSWRCILDGDEAEALGIYGDCMLLFSLLSAPHEQMNNTYIAMYMLALKHLHDTTNLDKLYTKIQPINTRDIPFVHYIHFKHDQKRRSVGEGLEYFMRLNKAVLADSWTTLCYPLSKQVIPQSSKEHVTEELQKYVTTTRQHFGKDTITRCVGVDCKTPGLYIVDSDLVTDYYNVLECSERCRQHYHCTCYKHLPKWAPEDRCFTPDCTGYITRLFEDGKLKREAKHTDKKESKGKTPAPPPPSSPRSRKRTQRKRSENSATKEEATVRSPTPPAPTPPPLTPEPAASAPAPAVSGDDVIDMFGTMLIYIEEYPDTHITTIAMYMNSVYSWVKVDQIYMFIEHGVQSFTINNEGIINLRPGNTTEQEVRKEVDINLLIIKHKDSDLHTLLQSCPAPRSDKAAVATSTTTSGTTTTSVKEKAWNKSGVKSGNSTVTAPSMTDYPYYSSVPDVGAPLPGKEKRPKSLNPTAAEFSLPSKPVGNVDPYTKLPFTTLTLTPGSHTDNNLYKQIPLNTPGHNVPTAPSPLRAGSPMTSTSPLNSPIGGMARDRLEGAARISGNPAGAGVNNPAKQTISYSERKALAEKIAQLELKMEEMRTKYEKEVNHYKTQLCQQIDVFSKLKAKAKLYKQDYKIAMEKQEDQTHLQRNYERLVKQIEEERKSWLSEREAKSIESKKLILKIRIELDEQKRANDEANSTIIQKNRENGELQEKLEVCETKAYQKDQEVMELRRHSIDLQQNYKLTQQQLVQERYNVSQLKLRIAYANCEAQIRERLQLSFTEGYNLPQWRRCQETIRNKIDDNRLRYDEYVDGLHNSREPAMIRFETEPACPGVDVGVTPVPLQRYDDILEGREAPPLATFRPADPDIAEKEMDILTSLMNDPSINSMISGNEPSLNSMMPSNEPSLNNMMSGSLGTAGLVASTPALPPPQHRDTSHIHFEFDNLQNYDSVNTSTRPPGASVPTDIPFDLADLMQLTTSELPVSSETRPPGASRPPANPETKPAAGSRPPSATETRTPRGSRPPSSGSDHAITVTRPPPQPVPVNAPLMPPTSLSLQNNVQEQRVVAPSTRGRGRSRSRVGNGPVPAAPPALSTHSQVGARDNAHSQVGARDNAPREPPPRGAGAMLKRNIKENHPHLSDGEINQYLRRVRDSCNLAKATPHFVLQRIKELVEVDYPVSSELPSPTPEHSCVICHDSLSSKPSTQLGCGHSFHSVCVDRWFREDHSCPTCRSHQPPLDMFPPLS